MSKEEWEQEIQSSNAYYYETEKNLYLFRNREDFWILNYYLNDLDMVKTELKKVNFDDSNIVKTELEKNNLNPIVVEIVSKNILEDSYQKQQELFNQLGWEKKLERERFEKTECFENLNKLEQASDLEHIENIKQQEIETIKINSKICFAQKEDLEKLLELLKEAFNPYYGCVPTKQKLEEDINKKFVYISKTEDKIIGVLHFKNTGKIAEIRHLATNKECRGKGIASQLMDVYEDEIKAPKKIVWTGTENMVAQGLYRKYGYQKDGYVSSVYMNKLNYMHIYDKLTR